MALEGMLILGAGVVLFLGYNYLRYGEWFNFGYPGEGFTGNLAVGLYGLLFSFGKGLILFAPITIFCIAWFMFKHREMEPLHRYLFTTSLISFVCYLIVYAKWGSWHGGWCWGPRFLLPFVPLIHIIFPFLWKSASRDNRMLSVGILLALGLGLAINVLNIANPLITNNMDIEMPFLDRMFFPEKTFIFEIARSGIGGSPALRGLAILGFCAFSLWVWKKAFSLKLSAPQPSTSEPA